LHVAVGGGVSVADGTGLPVAVGVPVAVAGGVPVAVGVAVAVDVRVAVAVAVPVAVAVGVFVAVAVGVFVAVGVLARAGLRCVLFDVRPLPVARAAVDESTSVASTANVIRNLRIALPFSRHYLVAGLSSMRAATSPL
jgi:hypothetical protein